MINEFVSINTESLQKSLDDLAKDIDNHLDKIFRIRDTEYKMHKHFKRVIKPVSK